MVRKKFLRRISSRHSKLGKRRKKKQVWRRPTGRDNKMREKRKGHPVVVGVGFRTDKKIKGLLNKKKPVLVKNINDLEKIQKNKIGILGSVGKKKKIEIANLAKTKKIQIFNLNPEKFLKKLKKKSAEKPVESKQKHEGKTVKKSVENKK